MRAAIYFTPPPEAETARLAAHWLGRDAFSGAASRAPDGAVDALVAEPALYGFHATMKAPFRLLEGGDVGALDTELAFFCREAAAATIGSLRLSRIGQFFALTPAGPEPALDALAAQTVRHFEPFRAPLSAQEREKRRPERLSERQVANLDAFGYPYVFEEFRFHMTLTGSVPDADAPAIEATLRQRFAAVLGKPQPVDGLALFVQPAPGAPFTVHSRHSLRPSETML